jgi:dissimilatory sulfite reductase (desulfoviridin) alpha/beta subunit
MRQAQKGKFSMRLKVIGWQLTSKQLAGISDITAKYGRGTFTLPLAKGLICRLSMSKILMP